MHGPGMRMATTLADVSSLRRYLVPQVPGVCLHVVDLGMACCAVEFVAGVARGLLVEVADSRGEGGTPPGASEHGQVPMNILIVSGTVTQPLASSVVDAWAGIPAPRAAIAFGACTISGGPYWDSYSVVAGIDDIIPIARYVPGCPPRPEAIVEALQAVARPLETRVHRSGEGG